jgi:hypothetical protein
MMRKLFSSLGLTLSILAGTPTAVLAYEYYLNVPVKATHIPDNTGKGKPTVRCYVYPGKDNGGGALAHQDLVLHLDAAGNFSDVLHFKITTSQAALSYNCGLYLLDGEVFGAWDKFWTMSGGVSGNF